MSKIEIYYFSGSGNSLFAARELQKRLPESDLIPVVRLLKQETIRPGATAIGLVFPVHMMTVPRPVKAFLKKLDVKSAEYIFAVATRGGTPSRAFTDIDGILKKARKRLDAGFILNMPYNDPKFDYKVPAREEIAEKEAAALARLDSISPIIINRQQSREKDTGVITPMPGMMVHLTPLLIYVSDHSGSDTEYYADSGCTGCGNCAKVCPARKIKMVDGRPSWQKEVRCFNCDACLNYCPSQASQIKSSRFFKFNTEKNGRYSHPYATLEDIAGQR